MKYPKTIKIGGHIYKLLIPYEFRERGDYGGQQDSSLNEIRIDTKDSWSHTERTQSNISVTIIHELIHCIDHVHGGRDLNGGSKEDERIVESLAQGLYQVFHDNKKLLKIFED